MKKKIIRRLGSAAVPNSYSTTHSIAGNTLLLKIEVTIDKIATCVLNETTYKFSSPIISPQKMANAKQMSKITQILLAYVDL